VTPTTLSPSPRSNSISVAAGASDSILCGGAAMAALSDTHSAAITVKARKDLENVRLMMAISSSE
jgi:hypothetical protein